MAKALVAALSEAICERIASGINEMVLLYADQCQAGAINDND
jgi:hypothetical protein